MKEELESQGELRVNQEVFPPTPSESEPVDALEALIAEFANCVKAYQDGFYLQDEQLVAAARAERAKLVEEVVWLLKKPSLHKEPYNPGEWCKRRDALLALLQTSGKAGR